jgi:xylulokinase
MGVGAIHPGDICTILGTTCATNIVTDVIEAGKENSRFEKHILDNMYVDLKPTMSGTTNIDWLFQTVAKDLSYQEVDENLITLPPVPTGVIYHPHLSTAGERSPFYDSNARSSFFGLNNGTDRFSMIKSVYEGIGFSIRDCLEYANVNENSVIYLAGGGAASKAWKQIIADITGLTIVVLEGTEFAAKGSVMGMAVTLGLYETFEDATRSMTHANEVYHPINESVVIYNEFYGLYKTLRNGYTELWAERTKILEKLNRGE